MRWCTAATHKIYIYTDSTDSVPSDCQSASWFIAQYYIQAVLDAVSVPHKGVVWVCSWSTLLMLVLVCICVLLSHLGKSRSQQRRTFSRALQQIFKVWNESLRFVRSCRIMTPKRMISFKSDGEKIWGYHRKLKVMVWLVRVIDLLCCVRRNMERFNQALLGETFLEYCTKLLQLAGRKLDVFTSTSTITD